MLMAVELGKLEGPALTLSTKLSLPGKTPALTGTVSVATLVRLGAGVTVTVRLAPAPPNTMLPLGTSDVLDELALKIRLSSGVFASATVKGIAGVVVFTVVVWSAILEM